MSKRYFRKNKSGEYEYVVPEDSKATQYYECAAWYTELTIPAGVYPAHQDTLHSNMVSVTVQGTIDNDWFPSLFGGVQYGSYDRYKNAGKPINYYSSVYKWEVSEEGAE